MAETRRPAEESRSMLIEAAVEIIRTEGYGALSARRLAEKVGLKRQIVHYYFRTIDELLLATVRHYGDRGLAVLSETMRDDPLRAIWEVQADASATTFAFMAMATHRPAVKKEVLRYMDKFRRLQTTAITDYYASRGVRTSVPPVAMAIILQSVSQALSAEASLGCTRGHAETRALVGKLLDALAAGASPGALVKE